MSMTATQLLDGSDDAVTAPIDVRNALNVSITIVTVEDADGAYTIEGSDDVAKITTQKATGTDQGVVWADITAMADSSGDLGAPVAGGATVVSLFNPPAFVRVKFVQSSGEGDVQVFVSGRG